MIDGFEPNEGTEGKLLSNKTGENIEHIFDYGQIHDDRVKDTAEEIVKILRDNQTLSIDDLIKELTERFQLIEYPMHPVEESLWHIFTENEKIGTSIQGVRQIGTDENGYRIPHIAFSADLDYLDEFLIRLIETAQKINIKEIREVYNKTWKK